MKFNLLKYILETGIENALKSIALMLSVINALILLQNYLNNKPKVHISSVDKEKRYLWWTKLPQTLIDGKKVVIYGFILYMSIENRGNKKIRIDEWFIKVNPLGNKAHDLYRLPIPIAEQKLMDGSKIVYPVLGQLNNALSGNTVIESGDITSGFTFYADRYFEGENGKEAFNIINNIINVEFWVINGYGKKKKCRVTLTYKPFNEINEIMPNLDKAMYKENASVNFINRID